MPDIIHLALEAACRDLLDRHARELAPTVEGSVLRLVDKGHACRVATRRLGDAVVDASPRSRAASPTR